jgi:hypothetical protein
MSRSMALPSSLALILFLCSRTISASLSAALHRIPAMVVAFARALTSAVSLRTEVAIAHSLKTAYKCAAFKKTAYKCAAFKMR